MNLKALFSMIFLILFVPCLNAEDSFRYPAHSLKEFRSVKRLTLCNELVPLDDEGVWERLDREFVISLGDKPQVVMWLKRSRRYFPYIERKLKERSLPDDIKYLAVIESDLKSYAFSPKGAVGSWQFVKNTGRRLNLRVNRWFDDRRNFYKSTDAALEYLSNLYKSFDKWAIAFAAYNCGGGRIKREIEEQNVDDYYKLNLPIETERFVFRILSAKIILSDPDKYGFHIEDDEYYHPVEFDEVWVNIPSRIHVRVIAEATDSLFKEIKELNPEIRGYYLPKGRHVIAVPKGSSGLFKENFQKHLREPKDKRTVHVYKVKEGDNLTSIARMFNVRVASLMMWNEIERNRFIYPGQEIRILEDKAE